MSIRPGRAVAIAAVTSGVALLAIGAPLAASAVVADAVYLFVETRAGEGTEPSFGTAA